MISKEKTAELGKSLKKVYRNEISVDEAVDVCKSEITNLIENAKEKIEESKKKNSDTGNLADVITNNAMNEASENTEDNESCDPAPSDEVSE